MFVQWIIGTSKSGTSTESKLVLGSYVKGKACYLLFAHQLILKHVGYKVRKSCKIKLMVY